MPRTVGAIERDMDNAGLEADRGYPGSADKLAALQAELDALTPTPEPEPEPEPAPVEDEPKPKAKTRKK